MKKAIQSLCYSCEKPVQDDRQLRGRWVCGNARCIRFGLITTIVLQPQPTPPKVKEVKDDKDIPPVGGK